jgi:hypothetical protein
MSVRLRLKALLAARKSLQKLGIERSCVSIVTFRQLSIGNAGNVSTALLVELSNSPRGLLIFRRVDWESVFGVW